jgi:hypothetical protein
MSLLKEKKIRTADVDALHDYIWDYCRERDIFIELRDKTVSHCSSASCKDFDGREHVIPIGVVLRKENKKLSNVIILSHEAGHLLDYRDNPKGWQDGEGMAYLAFEHPQGFEMATSPERLHREKEAWKRGRSILEGSPHFTPAIRRKFRRLRRKALGGYAARYRAGRRYLIAGRKPVDPKSPVQLARIEYIKAMAEAARAKAAAKAARAKEAGNNKKTAAAKKAPSNAKKKLPGIIRRIVGGKQQG